MGLVERIESVMIVATVGATSMERVERYNHIMKSLEAQRDALKTEAERKAFHDLYIQPAVDLRELIRVKKGEDKT
jgi:hypothetical protein